MIIGVDVDNVLNNLTECVLQIYNADSGDNLQLEDITSYNISRFMKPSFREKLPKYFADQRVWDNIQPNTEGFECINNLFKKGHMVYLVTATHPYNVARKYDWLSQYCEFDVYKYLIVACDKSIVQTDVLIDDCSTNLLFRQGVNILYGMPWNEACQDSNIIRVKNWTEIQELINKEAKK